MKVFIKLFTVLFFVSGLILISCSKKSEGPETREISSAKEEAPEPKIKYPWDNYGYEKQSQFHLRYYYIFGEAIGKVLKGEMSWEEAIKDNTGIAEVWFKSDGSLFRLDRYIEKLEAKCQSYKGKPPDTISHNDKIYSLYERIVQKGTNLTSYTFSSGEQIDYDNGKKQAIAKDCFYEKFNSEKKKPVDHGSAISWMMMGHQSGAGFGFYLNQRLDGMDEDLEELGKAALELTKMMNPPEYKKIIEGWKVKKKIAGRTAVKDYDSPPTIGAVIGMKGFQFIDTELGIGLAGYLEECPKSWMYKETKFEEPKLMYQALLVETNVYPDVFENF